MNNSDPATGQAYSQTAAAGTTRLNFNGNTATNTAATDEVLLTQAGGGTFTVEDLADIETLNNGAQVQQVGTITDDAAGNIPQPSP
jgi:hypothetical protein